MKHRHTWLYLSAGKRSTCGLPSAGSAAQAAITYRKLTARRAVLMLSIILALLLAVSAAFPIGAVNTPNGYVDDAAGVLDSDTGEYIRSRSDALCKLTGAQIVIATTRSLNGETIDRYAERYFLDREIGDKNKDNGVLLLMAIDDGNYWLTKGGGLESALPVSALRTMLDSIFEPSFAAGEYSVGTKALFDALYGKLCALYGVNPSPTSGSSALISGSTDTQTEAQNSERGILPYMLLAIIAAAIVTVVIFLVRAVRTPADDGSTDELDGSPNLPRDTAAVGRVNSVGAAKSTSQYAGTAERTDKISVGAVGSGKGSGNTRTAPVSDGSARIGSSARIDSSSRSAAQASSALAALRTSASQAKASAAPTAASAPAAAPAMAEVQTPEELQRILLARRRAGGAGNARAAQSSGAAQSGQASASDITVPRRAPSAQSAQAARSGQESRRIQNTTPVQRQSARTANTSGRTVQQRQSAQRPPQPEGPFAYHSDRDYDESRLRRDSRRR